MLLSRPLPKTLHLSDLIDCGYSQCYAIQFNWDYDMDHSDFFLFNENSRERWGDTLMFFEAEVLRSKDGTAESGYLRLKLIELQLTHEYREQLKAEREERAEMARAAREEQKFLRDMERAEEEENRYQRLLEKAKLDASKAAADQIGAYNDKIEMLEKDLADAHAKFERAQAMAEKTRSGYVYIISNIGSFGEEVVKIGLTRRLDPADRVRELGDASVPFVFDTHAIIYSDDAPALERALHNEFQKTRINAQNFRKEFFRVSIEEVEKAVTRLAPGAPFFKDVEAQEYRETLARRNAMLAAVEPPELVAFPSAI